jgi:hypothetical protein
MTWPSHQKGVNDLWMNTVRAAPHPLLPQCMDVVRSVRLPCLGTALEGSRFSSAHFLPRLARAPLPIDQEILRGCLVCTVFFFQRVQ